MLHLFLFLKLKCALFWGHILMPILSNWVFYIEFLKIYKIMATYFSPSNFISLILYWSDKTFSKPKPNIFSSFFFFSFFSFFKLNLEISYRLFLWLNYFRPVFMWTELLTDHVKLAAYMKIFFGFQNWRGNKSGAMIFLCHNFNLNVVFFFLVYHSVNGATLCSTFIVREKVFSNWEKQHCFHGFYPVFIFVLVIF